MWGRGGGRRLRCVGGPEFPKVKVTRIPQAQGQGIFQIRTGSCQEIRVTVALGSEAMLPEIFWE